MHILPALILAAAQLQPFPEEQEVPTEATDPYRCSVAVAIDGLSGGMWRDFHPGRPDDFYIIQLQSPQVDTSPFALWSVDNRPAARPRVYGWLIGRPESDVFRQGPDSVAFGTVAYGEVRDGPVFAQLYGDGRLAGQFLAQTGRRTRSAHSRGARGLYLSVHQRQHPEIVARLADAREWRALLVDSAGRELGSKTVRVPRAGDVQAEFARARAELLRHREEFLRRPTWNRDRPCSTFIEERDAPI